MFPIVGLLPLPAACGFPNQRLDRFRLPVGKQDHLPVQMPGRPTRRLDQRGFRPQISLLVRIENADQGNLGQVQSLPEQIDPHQNINLAGPQLPQDLHPLDGIHLGMEIAGLKTSLLS